MEVTRKCDDCKEPIIILKEEFLMGLGKTPKFYHKSCYEKSRLRDFKSKSAKENYYKKVDRMTTKAKDYVKNNLDKDKFFTWIYNNYGVCALANHVFMRIADINSGTYKGLTEPITYEDLLDMFKRKKKELDKIANNKERRGKGFKDNVNARLLYDLAVIVAKYDSYKAWKQKQKLYETQTIIKKEEEKNKIDYSKINKNSKENSKVDLGDILEDIY